MRGLTLVRADASQREWFARNGVAVHAVSRAPLNTTLDRVCLIRIAFVLAAIWAATPEHQHELGV